MDREVIKRKIEKLLALSKSTNESEAMSAARTARKLMLKYHISMADGEKTGGEIPCVKFIGFEEDAFAALTLLQYLIRFMEQGAGQYAGMRHQEQSFKDGFCAGVFETFEAQNQEEPGYGLMLETPAEVMEAYKKLNLKKESAVKRRTPDFLNGSAFSCGKSCGRQAMDQRSIPPRE